jgi:hypothetical protein
MVRGASGCHGLATGGATAGDTRLNPVATALSRAINTGPPQYRDYIDGVDQMTGEARPEGLNDLVKILTQSLPDETTIKSFATAANIMNVVNFRGTARDQWTSLVYVAADRPAAWETLLSMTDEYLENTIYYAEFFRWRERHSRTSGVALPRPDKGTEVANGTATRDATAWDTRLNPVVTALSQAINGQFIIRDIAMKAGLPIEHVRNAPDAEGYWAAVLECALDEGDQDVDAVLSEALVRTERKAAHEAVEEYRRMRGR